MNIIKKINHRNQTKIYRTIVEFIKEIMSPTYLFAKIIKKKLKQRNKAEFIIFINSLYFVISIFITILLLLNDLLINYPPLTALVIYYAFSRVNEIFFAFKMDTIDKLKYNTNYDEDLKFYERIHLALKSFLELILDYAMLYYMAFHFLNDFNHHKSPFFNTILDAVYYSGVTITTVGYGDISSMTIYSRLLSIYEVINGMLLVVVCFTIYLTLHHNRQKNLHLVDKPHKYLVTKVSSIFIIVNYGLLVYFL